MVIGNTGNNLTLESMGIKLTDQYKYLGVQITNERQNTEKITSRISQGIASIRQLYDTK